MNLAKVNPAEEGSTPGDVWRSGETGRGMITAPDEVMAAVAASFFICPLVSSNSSHRPIRRGNHPPSRLPTPQGTSFFSRVQIGKVHSSSIPLGSRSIHRVRFRSRSNNSRQQ